MNRAILLILVFGFLIMGIFFSFDSRKKRNQEQHLQLISERYQLAYNTVYGQYKQLAVTLHSGISNRFDIPGLYQQLLTADEAQKNRLRQDLLTRLMPRYKELHEGVKLRQLHFHLSDNGSFLRFHRPENLGDNLAGIRETVMFVNREHLPIDGFEEGRIYNGYRFVFPITGPDQTHLGSMELSFGPEALTATIMKQYAVFANFYIKELIVQKKVLIEEQRNNYRQSHQPGYLFDNNALYELEKVSGESISALRPQQRTIDTVYANAQNNQAISFYDPAINMAYTTLPVLNPVTGEMVAFLTIRSHSDQFLHEKENFWFFFSLSLLLLFMVMAVFFQQFTKKKMTEEHNNLLEQQKQRLVEAQEIAKLGHWELDFASNCSHWSDQIYRILGMIPQQVVPSYQKFLERIHPDDLNLVKAAYTDSISNHQVHDIQHRILTVAGEEKWIREIWSTEYDETDKPARKIGILHDITEIMRMEKEVLVTKDRLQSTQHEERQKRFDSLKTMAGAIAHRFNNAMMVTLCNLELLTKTLAKNSDEYQLAADAAQAGKGASQVGSMMLSYVGQEKLYLQQKSLFELVRESLTGLEILSHPSITLNCTPPLQPLLCNTDPQRIKEVIENILSNAMESLDDASGAIEITFDKAFFTCNSFPIPFQGEHLQDGMYVYCQVKDSGHGIEPEDLQHLFDPFYTTRFVGRGLGLPLTVGILWAHRGAITVESTPGRGTTVRILLPAIPSSVQQSTPLQDAADEIAPLSGHVLFVDDEQMVLSVGRKLLETLGLTVQTAIDGREAVELVRSRNSEFSAVLMDISMPDMDGIEAMHHIKELNPALPVILCSGYIESDLSISKGLGNGPDGLLEKPFRLSDIRSSLETVLS